MKKLENILKILVRIVNLPLAVLFFIIMLILVFFLMIFSLIEFFTVMPIYYVATGRWYYDSRNFKHPYDKWFPIANNMETYIDAIPGGTINEDRIDLSKHYKKTEDNG